MSLLLQQICSNTIHFIGALRAAARVTNRLQAILRQSRILFGLFYQVEIRLCDQSKTFSLPFNRPIARNHTSKKRLLHG
jgi:hypothetical protein